MKVNKAKKLLLALGLGMGMSVSISASAGVNCNELLFECHFEDNTQSCLNYTKYCGNLP